MGDRHRATLADLLGEGGDDRAAGAEDVAEAHRDVAARLAQRELGGEALGHPLARAQHRGGAGGLVGGDVDKGAHAVLCGGGQHVEGAQHVGLPGLLGVALQQAEVLERRCVEDDVRAGDRELRAQVLRVPDVGEHEVLTLEQAAPGQRELHGVQGGLVTVQHDEPRRGELGDLPAQLGADGPTSAGDQHDLAGEVVGDRLLVELHGAAAEQVLQVDVAKVRRLRVGLAQPVLDRGEHLHLEVQLARLSLDVTQQLGGSARNRDGEVGRARLLHGRRQLGEGPHHRDALDLEAALAAVVVEEGDRRELRAVVVQHVVHQPPTGEASAEDDDLLAVRVAADQPRAVGAHEEASGQHQDDRQCRGQQGTRPRDEDGRRQPGDRHERESGDERRPGQRRDLVEAAAHVTDQVRAGQQAHDRVDAGHEAHSDPQARTCENSQGKVKSAPYSNHQGKGPA